MRYRFRISGTIEPHLHQELVDYLQEKEFEVVDQIYQLVPVGGLVAVSYEFYTEGKDAEEATSIAHLFQEATVEMEDIYVKALLDIEAEEFWHRLHGY